MAENECLSVRFREMYSENKMTQQKPVVLTPHYISGMLGYSIPCFQIQIRVKSCPLCCLMPRTTTYSVNVELLCAVTIACLY